MPGARCQSIYRDFGIQIDDSGGRGSNCQKTTFQAGMCMKTKNEVSGARCKVSEYLSRLWNPDRRFGRARIELPENDVPSRNVYENKVHGPKSEVRSPKSKGLGGGCAYSDSWLLAPDSCTSRNEGVTGDVDENKGPGTWDRGILDTGRRRFWLLLPKDRWPSVERGAHAPVMGYPGNMLKIRVRQNPITHHKSPFANALAPVF